MFLLQDFQLISFRSNLFFIGLNSKYVEYFWFHNAEKYLWKYDKSILVIEIIEVDPFILNCQETDSQEGQLLEYHIEESIDLVQALKKCISDLKALA